MDSMNIQWYPGHMTKTRRQMEQDLKLVDGVCELLDARIPVSSRNPDIAALCGAKPRLVILNRMDMADPAATRAWCEFLRIWPLWPQTARAARVWLPLALLSGGCCRRSWPGMRPRAKTGR